MGGTYLALLSLLRLEDHPSFQRPTDPSLFIARYADKLGLERDAQARGYRNWIDLCDYSCYLGLSWVCGWRTTRPASAPPTRRSSLRDTLINLDWSETHRYETN